jgi:hypothetical protein
MDCFISKKERLMVGSLKIQTQLLLPTGFMGISVVGDLTSHGSVFF